MSEDSVKVMSKAAVAIACVVGACYLLINGHEVAGAWLIVAVFLL